MKKFSQLAFPYIVWAILMLVFPMVLIALYSVTDQGNSILSFTFTLEHYAKFFTDPDFLLILWRSIVIAVKTTVICLLLGYPIAYYIARSEQKKQNALILVITLCIACHSSNADQHAGKNVCMDRTLKRRRSDPENPAYGGTWKGITSLYRRGSASWYGI